MLWVGLLILALIGGALGLAVWFAYRQLVRAVDSGNKPLFITWSAISYFIGIVLILGSILIIRSR